MYAFLSRVRDTISTVIAVAMKIIFGIMVVAVAMLGIYALAKAAGIILSLPGDWGISHRYTPRFGPF